MQHTSKLISITTVAWSVTCGFDSGMSKLVVDLGLTQMNEQFRVHGFIGLVIVFTATTGMSVVNGFCYGTSFCDAPGLPEWVTSPWDMTLVFGMVTANFSVPLRMDPFHFVWHDINLSPSVMWVYYFISALSALLFLFSAYIMLFEVKCARSLVSLIITFEGLLASPMRCVNWSGGPTWTNRKWNWDMGQVCNNLDNMFSLVATTLITGLWFKLVALSNATSKAKLIGDVVIVTFAMCVFAGMFALMLIVMFVFGLKGYRGVGYVPVQEVAGITDFVGSMDTLNRDIMVAMNIALLTLLLVLSVAFILKIYGSSKVSSSDAIGKMLKKLLFWILAQVPVLITFIALNFVEKLTLLPNPDLIADPTCDHKCGKNLAEIAVTAIAGKAFCGAILGWMLILSFRDYAVS